MGNKINKSVDGPLCVINLLSVSFLYQKRRSKLMIRTKKGDIQNRPGPDIICPHLKQSSTDLRQPGRLARLIMTREPKSTIRVGV